VFHGVLFIVMIVFFEMFYDVFWIFQSINVSYYVVFCNGCIVPLRYFVVYFGLLIYYQYDVPQA
jgi:hypothetical protein